MRPVTVVVPIHQSLGTLAACLRAIVRNAGSHPDWNLLVVDDDSLDVKGVAAAVAECPGAQLLRIPRGGVARAMNAARAHPLAKGRDLLRVHADVVVDSPDFIARLGEAATDRVGVVGVRLVYPDGRVQSEGRNLLNGLGFHPQHRDRRAYQLAGVPGKVIEVDGVSGACAYYRVETLEAAGGFDENYGGAWLDDDDFCIAARRRNWSVVVHAGVRAVHFTPSHAPTFQRGVVDADADIQNFAGQARQNAVQLHGGYWCKKWGWNPFYPDLGEVRRLYGHTAICWQLGEPLRLRTNTAELPAVDCCLVTWNTLALLRRCLESLALTDYPADRVRVYIADNASTDGTREALAELAKTYPFPIVVIPLPVNTGCPAGLNAAIVTGSADLVARLDDDIVLPPDWLRTLVGTLRARPYAACVGPKILNNNATHTIQCGPFRHWPPIYGHEDEADQGQADYVARTTHVRGCCNLYRRDALQRVGLLDVRYSPSQLDDPDHHLALLHAGYEIIYDGRVGVVHKLNNGLGITTAALSNQTANHHKMQGKWGAEAYRILERAIDLSREGRVLPDDGDTTAWLATGPSPELFPLHSVVSRESRLEFFRRYDELVKLRARPTVADWSDEYLLLAQSRSLHGKARNALDLALSALGFAPLRVETYAAVARFYALLGQPAAADELRRVGRLLFPAAAELAEEDAAAGMAGADMRTRIASIGESRLGADDLAVEGAPPVRLRVLMVNTFESRLPGGDMHQLKKTRQYLRSLGVQADIACCPRPDPRGYDLVHVWNTVFPHQTLCQIKGIRAWRPDVPMLLSPIYWDCRERYWADQAVPAIFTGSANAAQLNERLQSLASDQLLVNGTLRKNAGEPVHPGYEEYQRECIQLVDHLLPQSTAEIANIRAVLGVERPYTVVRNGAETSVFTSATPGRFVERFGKRDFVLTVGLVEQRKNQLMLLQALRDTGLPVVVIGRHWDRAYYRLCRRFAPPGTLFIDHLPHDELASAFAAARVHALPSWMECAAFAHVEAALAGCPLVAGNRTSEREYFGNNAYYADPANVGSIREAVLQAVRNRDADATKRAALRKRFAKEFTWEAAARATLAGYEAALAVRTSARHVA